MSNNSRRTFVKNLTLAATAMGGIMLDSAQAAAKDKTTANPSASARTANGKAGIHCDLMVYGGTSAGVIAAYTAKMYGLHVIVVEPGRHLGGLSSGGLGATDTGGHSAAITGMAKAFYLKAGQHYGHTQPLYRFEPHVAENIFNQYVNEAGIEVLYSRRVQKAATRGKKIRTVTLEYAGDPDNVIQVEANIFIDASYEGDLMAKAGVSYTVGREPNEKYGELFNGVILSRVAGRYPGPVKRTSEWPVKVDPFVQPGKPSSGLLPQINGMANRKTGSGDDSVQAYCFRLCLTQEKDNWLPLDEPANYDPYNYELLARLLKKKPWKTLQNGFNIAKMPRGKTDWNNDGLAGLSSDYIGQNFKYPDAGYTERQRIWQDHIDYQKGLLWFIAQDQRVPLHLRKEMQSWGYCRDEFLDTGGWSPQLYIREARRMVSDFVMTEHECVGKNPVTDGIAYGIYPIDSHSCRRVVVEDHVENEGNTFIRGIKPYPIAYRSLVPKRTEITNLLVPACLSASHSAFGSIRMEPVFMCLGQATGIAAYMALQSGRTVQDVNIQQVQKELADNPLANTKVPRDHKDIFAFKVP